MTRSSNKMALAVAGALVATLLVGVAGANTVSDQGKHNGPITFNADADGPDAGANPAEQNRMSRVWEYTNDWCLDATDSNGMLGADPQDGVEGTQTCDDNDGTFDGATTEARVTPGAAFQGCGADTADGTHEVGADPTVCIGGFNFAADIAFGAGNFGGDYSRATSVTISIVTSTGPGTSNAASFSFRPFTRNMATGVVTTQPTTAPTCVSAGVPFIYNAPAGESIDSISAFRNGPPTALAAPCNVVSNVAGVAHVRGDWSYFADDDSSAIADINIVANPFPGTPGLCEIEYSATATAPAGVWSEATAEVAIAGQDVFVLDFGSSGSMAGATVTIGQPVPGGTNFMPAGTRAEIVATVWAMGQKYETAYDSVFCDLPSVGVLAEPLICVAHTVPALNTGVGLCAIYVNAGGILALVGTAPCAPVGTSVVCSALPGSCDGANVAALAITLTGGPTTTTLDCSGTVAATITVNAATIIDAALGTKAATGAYTCTVAFASFADLAGGACVDTLI